MRKWLQYLVSISAIMLTIYVFSSLVFAQQEGSNMNNQSPVDGVTLALTSNWGSKGTKLLYSAADCAYARTQS